MGLVCAMVDSQMEYMFICSSVLIYYSKCKRKNQKYLDNRTLQDSNRPVISCRRSDIQPGTRNIQPGTRNIQPAPAYPTGAGWANHQLAALETDMAVAQDIAFVGQLIDAYAVDAWRMSVASEDPKDAGVPPEMQASEVNDEGWVEWRVLPSTLADADVTALENEFGVKFPPLFRAYLLARFQLFDQVKSRRYDQQIFMTDTPSRKPLKLLRDLIKAWRPLVDAGYTPFAQWGDGWGPMCFDSCEREADGECPVVWMDHELLIPLGSDKCGQRESVLPLAQPLYGSCREFLVDVFGRG